MPSLEFKRIELSDKEIVNNFLNKTNSNSCQMTFANLFCLREKYNTEKYAFGIMFYLFVRRIEILAVKIIKLHILFRYRSGTGNLESAINLIIEISRKEGHRPLFFCCDR